MRNYFTKEAMLIETEVVSAIKQWAYPLKSKADLQPLFYDSPMAAVFLRENSQVPDNQNLIRIFTKSILK